MLPRVSHRHDRRPLCAPLHGCMPPSFLESNFCTRREYEASLLLPEPERQEAERAAAERVCATRRGYHRAMLIDGGGTTPGAEFAAAAAETTSDGFTRPVWEGATLLAAHLMVTMGANAVHEGAVHNGAARRRAVELGAESGLPGIMLAHLGYKTLITDCYEPDAIAPFEADIRAQNAACSKRLHVAAINWDDPPAKNVEVVRNHLDGDASIVVASEVVYTVSGAHAFVRTLAALLRAGGHDAYCLMQYQRRSDEADEAFACALVMAGLYAQRGLLQKASPRTVGITRPHTPSLDTASAPSRGTVVSCQPSGQESQRHQPPTRSRRRRSPPRPQRHEWLHLSFSKGEGGGSR